jgi:hypothetical protein
LRLFDRRDHGWLTPPSASATSARPAPRAAAKELAKSSGRKLDIQLQQESESTAFFAARSMIITVRRVARPAVQ